MASVVSWSVRWTPDRAVLVRALAGDIMLCSWTRHFTLTVPLSTRGVQTGASEFNAGGGGGGGESCNGLACDIQSLHAT